MKRIQKLRPAAAAFLLMFAMSTTTSGISFLNGPIGETLNVGMGTVTTYYSVMVAVSTLSVPVVGQLLGKLGARRMIGAAALWGAFCMGLFSLCRGMWMFYVCGALMGLLGSTAANLMANVVLQTYYTTTQAAGMIGIVMAGSGVGSVVFSTLVPAVLEAADWRMAYRALGVTWFGLLACAFLLVGKARPMEEKRETTAVSSGMTRKEALRSPVLYVLLADVLIMDLGFTLMQHFPMVLAEQGYTAAGAAAVISFFSAVLTVGKIGQGILYSKVGVKKGSIPMFFLYVLAFLLLCIPGMAYPAFFCLALGMGTLTTLVPLISKVIFGQREYAAIYSIVSMSMSIGTFVGTPCWGLLYDLTGSYRGGFLVMAALLAAAFLLQNLALKLREKELKNGENL